MNLVSVARYYYCCSWKGETAASSPAAERGQLGRRGQFAQQIQVTACIANSGSSLLSKPRQQFICTAIEVDVHLQFQEAVGLANPSSSLLSKSKQQYAQQIQVAVGLANPGSSLRSNPRQQLVIKTKVAIRLHNKSRSLNSSRKRQACAQHIEDTTCIKVAACLPVQCHFAEQIMMIVCSTNPGSSTCI